MGKPSKRIPALRKQQQQQQQQHKHFTTSTTLTTTPSVDDLVAEANAHVVTCDYELALNALHAALKIDPANFAVLEAAGVVLMDLGLVEQARQHFQEAVRLRPNDGYSKYMYLGQLSISSEAVTHFRRGVELMSQELEKLKQQTAASSVVVGGANGAAAHGIKAMTEEEEEEEARAEETEEEKDNNAAKSLAREISSALVAMTEIYLTDLCMEPDAESNCEAFLNQAVSVDASNPEVYQTLASVRLSQQRDADARAAVAQGMDVWRGLEIGHPNIPSYESRISLVKVLLELSQFPDALTVLAGLENEDEKTVELWYLYGYAYYLIAEDPVTGTLRTGDAVDILVVAIPPAVATTSPTAMTAPMALTPDAALRNARECLRSAMKWYRLLESDDEGIRQHVHELLENLRRVLPEGHDDDNDEDEEDALLEGCGDIDEAEWEDVSEEEGDEDRMEM